MCPDVDQIFSEYMNVKDRTDTERALSKHDSNQKYKVACFAPQLCCREITLENWVAKQISFLTLIPPSSRLKPQRLDTTLYSHTVDRGASAWTYKISQTDVIRKIANTSHPSGLGALDGGGMAGGTANERTEQLSLSPDVD